MAKKYRYSQARMEGAKQLRIEYDKLMSRLNRISKKYGRNPAMDELKERGLDKLSLRGMTLEQIAQARTDIEQISTFPSSRLNKAGKTALERYNEYVVKWIDLFDNDKDTYNKVMKIYGRMVNENEWTEHMKYQVIEEIMSSVSKQQMSDEAIHNYIRDLVTNAYEVQESNMRDIGGGRPYGVKGSVRRR